MSIYKSGKIVFKDSVYVLIRFRKKSQDHKALAIGMSAIFLFESAQLKLTLYQI